MPLLAAGEKTMSQYAASFLLVPIPEDPALDCAPSKVIKLVVLGGSGVGKTALIVRFLTKRFIGDYEANTGCEAVFWKSLFMRFRLHLWPGKKNPRKIYGCWL